MSGAGWRRRAVAAAAFGAAGWLSVALAWQVGGVDPMTFSEPEPWSWLPPASVAALAAALVGWHQAATFAEPAPPDTAGWLTAVMRGLVVTVLGFLLGCVLFPLAVGAVDAVAVVAADPSPSAVPEAFERVWGTLVAGFLLSLVAGSVAVLPVALALGGAAGWLVGRALGTPTPPAR